MKQTDLSKKILSMEFGDIIFLDSKGSEANIDGNPNCYYERIIHGWIYGSVRFIPDTGSVAKSDHFVFIREGQ
jgi:hypothetical protein